jgi:hypothetical protein
MRGFSLQSEEDIAGKAERREGSLLFYYEILNGLPVIIEKVKKVLPGRREDGKRSLSYYDILKRLNG